MQQNNFNNLVTYGYNAIRYQFWWNSKDALIPNTESEARFFKAIIQLSTISFHKSRREFFLIVIQNQGQDSNLQSSDPISDALLLRPHAPSITLDSIGRFRKKYFCKMVFHHKLLSNWHFNFTMYNRSCGLMDKASDFGSEDCRFESCHDRNLLNQFQPTIF